MGNRFNYRCPKCGSPDQIEICALVSVRLTGNGAEIADDVKDIDGSCWSSENAAGCGACGFQGAVKDFETSGATVIPLFGTRQASARSGGE
jgi:hypothetical protein